MKVKSALYVRELENEYLRLQNLAIQVRRLLSLVDCHDVEVLTYSEDADGILDDLRELLKEQEDE
jgi:hypothetical protein